MSADTPVFETLAIEPIDDVLVREVASGSVVEWQSLRNTEITVRCAAQRCMLRTSDPNVTAVSSDCTFA